MRIKMSYSVFVTIVVISLVLFGPPLTRDISAVYGVMLLSAYFCELVNRAMHYILVKKYVSNDSNKSDTVLPLKIKMFIWGCTLLAFLLGIFAGPYLGTYLIYDIAVRFN